MPEPTTGFQRFQQRYTRVALNWMNFCVLFVLVNLVIGFSFKAEDKAQQVAAVVQSNNQGRPRVTPLRDPWQLEHIDMDALKSIPLAEAEQMLDDTTRQNRQGMLYQPWVQFSSSVFQSQTVNVDADASPEFMHRRSVIDKAPVKGPWIDVYTFGGSTTFGHHASDRWTIASRLWEKLESRIQRQVPGAHIRVTNYGRLLYYSTQEAVLFNRLLRAGRRPHIAVFLDGLNDTLFMAGQVDEPNLSGVLRDLLETRQIGRKGTGLQEYTWIPMVKLAYTLRQKYQHEQTVTHPQIPPVTQAQVQSKFVIDTYRTNVAETRRNGASANVRCYFFVQPVPFYHYDLKMSRTPPVYPEVLTDMYQIVYDTLAKDADVIFLGKAIEEYGRGKKVFVDDVHYNPDFADFLAEKMAEQIDLSGLKPHD